MDSKRPIILAVRSLLRPVVRLMIALGFNARDFVEVAKTVYVEVASTEYGKRGRQTNMSRVAVLTGLTRREVSRLRKVSTHDPLPLMDPLASVGKVLAHWHQESPYIDSHGQPRQLSLKDFRHLLDTHRGDIPQQTIEKELEAAGAIHIAGGIVEARSRYFMPVQLEEQAVERFGRVLGDVGGAICENLLCSNTEKKSFEGRAVNERVAFGSRDAFQKFLDRTGQSFLEDVDDWLTDHSEPEDADAIRMGVGVYTIGDIE